ncbi:MAG: VWA domain-containing protein [Lentisphaerae bacterium]|nr:VWA domain-containing protein [Lentisphaerota bacterium]MCP4102913.1 VWA domain-containing protein [Lentisphaerota bacterium]
MKLNAKSLIAITVCAIILPTIAADAPKETKTKKACCNQQQAEQPQVDLVFVLDTTGSMSGLIKEAKEKIWSIVNTVSQARPTPKVRLGIIGFRDRGDTYVTDFNPMTEDIDKIYSRLMTYQAQGGGDRPESVNQALHEAVNKMNWSKNKKTTKTIFLVGDSPPHMDYQQDVKYQESCKLARKKDIVINTVLCGNHSDTRGIWQDIAQRGGGSFFEVEQGGSTITIPTPYDVKIKKIIIELEGCKIPYGDATIQRAAMEKSKVSGSIFKSASDTANAQRAEYKIYKSKSAPTTNDLLEKLSRKDISQKDIKTEKLPQKLQKMSSEQRAVYIKDLQAKRLTLTKQLRELSDKRQQYIRENISKKKLENSFENQVFKNMNKQMKTKGLELKESDLKL